MCKGGRIAWHDRCRITWVAPAFALDLFKLANAACLAQPPIG